VSGHADAETLAAFREELLSRRKAGRVSAHLAVCPRCAALDAHLAEVTAMLASSTAPPMPDALTARIEAALATEAATRSAAAAAPDGAVPVGAVPAGAAAGGHGPAAPGAGEGGRGAQGAAGGRRPSRPGPGRSWLALRVAAVTAAVAVVAGGGYGVAQLLSTRSPAATGSSSAGPGAPAARPRPVPRRPPPG
jgi:anti-sigma factor RsiW